MERSVQLKQFDQLCVILIEARFSFVACWRKRRITFNRAWRIPWRCTLLAGFVSDIWFGHRNWEIKHLHFLRVPGSQGLVRHISPRCNVWYWGLRQIKQMLADQISLPFCWNPGGNIIQGRAGATYSAVFVRNLRQRKLNQAKCQCWGEVGSWGLC